MLSMRLMRCVFVARMPENAENTTQRVCDVLHTSGGCPCPILKARDLNHHVFSIFKQDPEIFIFIQE